MAPIRPIITPNISPTLPGASWSVITFSSVLTFFSSTSASYSSNDYTPSISPLIVALSTID